MRADAAEPRDAFAGSSESTWTSGGAAAAPSAGDDSGGEGDAPGGVSARPMSWAKAAAKGIVPEGGDAASDRDGGDKGGGRGRTGSSGSGGGSAPLTWGLDTGGLSWGDQVLTEETESSFGHGSSDVRVAQGGGLAAGRWRDPG